MKPVLFLDFDGVISTFRAFCAQDDMADRSARWIDPIAIKLLERHLVKFPCDIVVSSAWRIGRSKSQIASYVGETLGAMLHDDWRTISSDDGMRGPEIKDWLTRNGERPFVILDDELGGMLDEQLPFIIQCDMYNGLTFENWNALEKLLESLNKVVDALPVSAIPDAATGDSK